MSTTDPPPADVGAGKLVIEYASFRDFVERCVGCLSREGIYVETERPRPVGSRVGLELQVSDGFRLLKGVGEVVWVRAAEGRTAAAGMGIRFQGLDGASRRLLDKVVESYEREGRPTFSLAPLAAVPSAAVRAAPEPLPVEPEPAVSPPPVATAEAPPSGAQPREAAPRPAAPSTEPPGAAPAAPRPEPEGVVAAEEITAPRPAAGEQLPLTPPRVTPLPTDDAPIDEAQIDEEPPDEEPPGEAEARDREPGDEVPAAGPPPPPRPTYPPEPEGAVERLFEEAARRDLQATPPSAPAERLGLDDLPKPLSPAEMLGPGPGAAEPAVASALEGAADRAHRPRRGRWLALGALLLALAAGGVWWSGAWRALVPGASEPGIEAQRPVTVAPGDAPREERRRAGRVPERQATTDGADVPADADAPSAAAAPDLDAAGPVALGPAAPGSGASSVGTVPGASAAAAPETAAPAPPPAPASVEEPAAGSVPAPPPVAADAPPGVAPPATPAARFSELRRITWQEREGATVLVLETDGAIPGGAFEVARIGGERPRQLIKLLGVRRGFSPSILEVGGPLVTRVRTGLHQEPEGRVLHVVADLADGGVRLRRAEARDAELRVVFGR